MRIVQSRRDFLASLSAAGGAAKKLMTGKAGPVCWQRWQVCAEGCDEISGIGR